MKKGSHNNRVKVLSVITDANIGGAGKMLLNLLKCSDPEEFSHAVVLPRGSLLLPEIEGVGVRCVEADGIAAKSLSFSAIGELCRIIRAENPDILHTHASLSARLAGRLAGGVRIVSTRHSVFAEPRYKKRFPVKNINKFINNTLSDAIIAVSPAVRADLLETGAPERKVHVVMNGVWPLKEADAAARAAARRRFGLGDGDFALMIAARLTPVKGHRYVIEAMKRLGGNGRVKLVVAGTGEIEGELRSLALGSKNIIFAGFVNDVDGLMNAMDVQLNASTGTEATSLALLEGMSLGKPAIVSDFGGNPFVIEDGVNGIVCPQRDAEAISRAILRLEAEPSLYAEMSRNAAKIFAESFTAEKMAKETEALYRRMLKID